METVEKHRETAIHHLKMSSNGEFPQLLEAKVRGFAMENEDATKTGVRFKKQNKLDSTCLSHVY